MNISAVDPTQTEPVLNNREVRSIMFGVMTAQMLAALDVTIISPALPSIGRDLGDVQLLPWIVTAYLIVSTALTPLYGKVADIRGRRVVLLFAMATFLLGTVACALARDMFLLVLARALQGVGGAGIFALSQTIIGDIVPPRQRAGYQVYTSAVWLIANLLGPVVGGVLSEYAHWSLIFWINLPIGIPAMLFVNARLKRLPRHERPHKLDLIGAFLLVVAASLLMLSLNYGGKTGWLSPQVIGFFTGAIIFWALLVWRQMSVQEPLIPLDILSNQVVRTGALTMFFVMGSYTALSIYLPMFLQGVSGLSVSAAGVSIIPLLIFTSAGAGLAAFIMNRTPNYKRLPLIGLAMSTVATVVLAMAPQLMPFWGVMLALTIISIGCGALFPVMNVCLQSSVAPHQLGTTMSLVFFLRSLGAAMFVALSGVLIVGGGEGSAIHGAAQATTASVAELAAAFSTVFYICAAAFAVGGYFFYRLEQRPLEMHRPQ
ncbi:MAG: transporter [Hyphomicrobiales bacterium]|nr:transporter [Hyphomicrobiales bacterium]